MSVSFAKAKEGLKSNVDHIIKNISQKDCEVILGYMNEHFRSFLLDLEPNLLQELKFIALTKEEESTYFEL